MKSPSSPLTTTTTATSPNLTISPSNRRIRGSKHGHISTKLSRREIIIGLIAGALLSLVSQYLLFQFFLSSSTISSNPSHAPFSNRSIILNSTQNRYFGANPLTSLENKRLLAHEPDHNFLALCHSTILQVNKLAKEDEENHYFDSYKSFASYYRLLGVNQIFFWYRPEVANILGFNQFRYLPYVTLIEFTAPTNHSNDDDDDDDSWRTVQTCLSRPQYARAYDWVLVAHVNDYWRLQNQRLTLRDWLLHPLTQYHWQRRYLSWGSYRYTTRHVHAAAPHLYPFRAQSPYCPTMPRTWCPHGSSAYLVQPRYAVHHDLHHGRDFFQHGYSTKELQHEPELFHASQRVWHWNPWSPNNSKQATTTHWLEHLDTQSAGVYMMEFVGLDRVEYRDNVTGHLDGWVHRNTNPFLVTDDTIVGIPDVMQGHDTVSSHEQGRAVPFVYDDQLQSWMEFVASGCLESPRFSKTQPKTIQIQNQPSHLRPKN